MFQNYMNQPSMAGPFQTGNEFSNPYLNRLQAMQPPMQPPQAPQMGRYEITRVNGRNGADAFQMPPNSAILLLDETQPVIWLKQTDGAGYPTCTPYTITPFQAQPEPDYNSLNERISRLEAVINGKPNAANAEPAGPAGGTDNAVGTK